MAAYTRDDLDKMADALRSLPAATKDKLSKQGVVRYLAAEIVGLQERGYTVERIAEILQAHGMSIAPRTLQAYLGRMKKRRRRAGKTAQNSKSRSSTVRRSAGPLN